jgi:HD-GYP domain-containing protein (c-di-GMP phosphodiesterase class II)
MRKGKTADEALAELRRCSGTQFDPMLVEAFLESLKIYGDPRTRPPSEDEDMPIHDSGLSSSSPLTTA